MIICKTWFSYVIKILNFMALKNMLQYGFNPISQIVNSLLELME